MKYKLIVFDIDGTIFPPVSSWRHLHEKLGLWDALACKYQEQFLAGKISYARFCRLDAAHWKGMPEEKVRRVFRTISHSRNAVPSVRKLKALGFRLAAISTGLQYLAERVKDELGFDYCLSNRLRARRGILTGGVRINISHGAKGEILKRLGDKFGVKPEETICVGDSAGDIPLAKKCGYSIAFNSTSRELSRIVDYNCRTQDFTEVLKKIREII